MTSYSTLMVIMALSASVSKLQACEICLTSILTSPGHSRSKPMAFVHSFVHFFSHFLSYINDSMSYDGINDDMSYWAHGPFAHQVSLRYLEK